MSRKPSSRELMTAALDQLPHERAYLFLFTFLSGLTAMQILYLALDNMMLNLWLSGALLAGFVYSYFLEPKFRPLTVYWVSLVAAALAIYYWVKIAHEADMLGNYLGILAGILVALLAFKAFVPGDHRFILMFCVVFLIFSSVASFDLKYMLLLPVFLLFAGSSLYIASQVDVAMRVGGEITRSVPLGHRIGRGFVKVLLRAVGGIIALSVAAYLVTPHGARENRNLILSNAPEIDPTEENAIKLNQTPQDGGIDGSGDDAQIGIGTDFDLADARKLTANPRPVLKVKSHRNGYMRAQVYDFYTGSGWIKSPEMRELRRGEEDTSGTTLSAALSEELVERTAFLFPLSDFPSEVTMRQLSDRGGVMFRDDVVTSVDKGIDLKYDIIRQQVSLLDEQPPYYFAMFQPYSIQNISLNKAGQRLDNPMSDIAGTVRPSNIDRPHPAHFAYTIQSIAPRYSDRDLRSVSFAGPEQLVDHYTQLPDGTPGAEELSRLKVDAKDFRPVTSRIRNFAHGVVQEGNKEVKSQLKTYQKVQAIYDYLTGPEFTYSTDAPELNKSQEITEAFCLGNQTGHCRYFASSMAVMCRINGVPARVVSGFAPGSYSLIENAYVYKASNAHAWCEVYFDGYGWITFDPSPSSRDVFNEGQAAEYVRGTVNFLQELFVLDPAGTQKTVLDAIKALWGAILRRGPVAIFTALSLAALIYLFRVRRARRRLRNAVIRPENSVIAAYLACVDELARIGRRLGPGETARRFLSTAGQGLHPLQQPLQELIPLYERAAYSPAAVTEQDAQTAGGVVTLIREFVEAELRRRRRNRG